MAFNGNEWDPDFQSLHIEPSQPRNSQYGGDYGGSSSSQPHNSQYGGDYGANPSSQYYNSDYNRRNESGPSNPRPYVYGGDYGGSPQGRRMSSRPTPHNPRARPNSQLHNSQYSQFQHSQTAPPYFQNPINVEPPNTQYPPHHTPYASPSMGGGFSSSPISLDDNGYFPGVSTPTPTPLSDDQVDEEGPTEEPDFGVRNKTWSQEEEVTLAMGEFLFPKTASKETPKKGGTFGQRVPIPVPRPTRDTAGPSTSQEMGVGWRRPEAGCK